MLIILPDWHRTKATKTLWLSSVITTHWCISTNADHFKHSFWYCFIWICLNCCSYSFLKCMSHLISYAEFVEERALLLGRLGRHTEALRIITHEVKDPMLAEEYCCEHFDIQDVNRRNLFMILLEHYLRPSTGTPDTFHALEVLRKHSDVRVCLCESFHLNIIITLLKINLIFVAFDLIIEAHIVDFSWWIMLAESKSFEGSGYASFDD